MINKRLGFFSRCSLFSKMNTRIKTNKQTDFELDQKGTFCTACVDSRLRSIYAYTCTIRARNRKLLHKIFDTKQGLH